MTNFLKTPPPAEQIAAFGDLFAQVEIFFETEPIQDIVLHLNECSYQFLKDIDTYGRTEALERVQKNNVLIEYLLEIQRLTEKAIGGLPYQINGISNQQI